MFGFSVKIAPLNLLAFFLKIFLPDSSGWFHYSRHFCHNRLSSRDHIWHLNLIFVRFATFIKVSTLQGYLLKSHLHFRQPKSPDSTFSPLCAFLDINLYLRDVRLAAIWCKKTVFCPSVSIFFKLVVRVKIHAEEKELKTFTAWKYDNIRHDETALQLTEEATPLPYMAPALAPPLFGLWGRRAAFRLNLTC